MRKILSPSKFNFIIIFSTITLLLLLAITVFIVDPFFHYRYPELPLNYRLDNERYQNDGIIRHFKYDAIITGTSMTENFKKTECDELFNVNSIKIPFSGSYFKETSDTIRRAYTYNPDIKLVIFSLDYQHLLCEPTLYNPQYTYPFYLYDDNLTNDINYLLNKDVALKTLSTLKVTAINETVLSFDAYEYWSERFNYGKEAILAINKRVDKVNKTYELTEEERQILLSNIQHNISELATEHPDTTFYLFFPPHSILFYDTLERQGELKKMFEIEQIVIEELLQYDNIKLFSMANDQTVICNLDNYIDQKHYSGEINTWILQCMSEDKHLLTEYNYEKYLDNRKEFINNFDYDSIYE